MKRKIIILITIILVILLMSCFVCKSNAVGLGALDDVEEYRQNNDSNSRAINIANLIIWTIRSFGTASATIMLLIIGIKYLLGSVEEKAEYKQTMFPYIIGAVLLFAGSTLPDLIYKAFN